MVFYDRIHSYEFTIIIQSTLLKYLGERSDILLVTVFQVEIEKIVQQEANTSEKKNVYNWMLLFGIVL